MEEIVREIEEAGYSRIRLGAFDVDGVMRGKYISTDKLRSALEHGLGFCDVIFGWDSSDELYDNTTYTGWHTGYPDAHARIEAETMRQVPWEDGIPFFLMDFYTPNGSPLPVSPRQVLRRVLGMGEEMGFAAKMASEYEFFLFEETPHSIREKGFQNLKNVTPGMFGYSAVRANSQAHWIHELLENLSELT